MINFLSTHFPLLNRIRLVYYLVGIETIVIAVYTFVTFDQLAEQLRSYTAASHKSQLSSQLAIKAEQIQRNADTFIDSGNQASADQVHYMHREMEEIIELLKHSGLRPQSLLYLNAIETHMPTYIKTFAQVEQQRFRQSELVQNQMRRRAEETEQQVQALLQSLPSQQRQTELLALQLLNQVIRAEHQATLYFSLFDIHYVELARSHLHQAKQLLSQFPTPLDLDDYHTLDASLNRFEEALVEAVQRTRGYLYLVNVVMAAEVSEILHQSEAIATVQHHLMLQIQEDIKEILTHTLRSALLFGLGFYLTIMVLSYTIGRSVTRPIQQLTIAFQRLAQGGVDAAIPDIHSKDEMGQLVQAAEVFKQTNADTKALLLQYQNLSAELESKVEQRTRQLQDKNEELQRLSTTDSLTGAVNRMKLETAIHQEIAKANRYQLPYSIIMLDIDHFKNINDQYGHQSGDQVLKQFVETLQSHVRESDIVGRWGGEEFIISCSCTALQSAALLAEKLRAIIAESCCAELSCTASVGVACYRSQETAEQLIARADAAMYQAKSNGRNQVCLEQDTTARTG